MKIKLSLMAIAGLLVFCGTANSDSPIPLCSGETDHAWVQEQQDMLREGELFQYAVQKLGPPTACDAKKTDQSDEGTFGKLTFHFKDGSTFTAESMPPETSQTALTMIKGFPDDSEAIRHLKKVTKTAGLHVNWSKPEINRERGIETKTFYDPTDGVNGRGVLTYAKGRLIAIEWGMAL